MEIAELRRPFPSGRDAAEGGEGGEGRLPPPSRRATECLLRPSRPFGPRRRRRGRGGHTAGRPPLPGNALLGGRRGREGPGDGAEAGWESHTQPRGAPTGPSPLPGATRRLRQPDRNPPRARLGPGGRGRRSCGRFHRAVLMKPGSAEPRAARRHEVFGPSFEQRPQGHLRGKPDPQPGPGALEPSQAPAWCLEAGKKVRAQPGPKALTFSSVAVCANPEIPF